MIPKILYHGTTRARWELGISQKGLLCDMPRHLLADEKHSGYVFLAERIEDAAFYALYQQELDRYLKNRFMAALNGAFDSGVILSVRTSNIRKNIEKDPEYFEVKQDYEKANLLKTATPICMNGMWYRHKGDIPPKYIMIFREIIRAKQEPEIIQTMNLFATGKIKEQEKLLTKNLGELIQK